MNGLSKIFFSLLLGTSILYSASSRAQLSDTLTYFPNDRVRGGAPTFYDTMSYMLHYPHDARSKRRVGTIIAAVTITPRGKMEMRLLNSLGSDIDRSVRQAFSAAKDIWLADDYLEKDVTICVPITFVLDGTQYNRSAVLPDFLMPEIVVVGYQLGKIRPDIFLVTKANELYIEKRYKRAMKYLDELIRRNPFNKNLYLMRGTARYHTGDSAGACNDIKMINTLLRQPVPAEAATFCQSP